MTWHVQYLHSPIMSTSTIVVYALTYTVPKRAHRTKAASQPGQPNGLLLRYFGQRRGRVIYADITANTLTTSPEHLTINQRQGSTSPPLHVPEFGSTSSLPNSYGLCHASSPPERPSIHSTSPVYRRPVPISFVSRPRPRTPTAWAPISLLTSHPHRQLAKSRRASGHALIPRGCPGSNSCLSCRRSLSHGTDDSSHHCWHEKAASPYMQCSVICIVARAMELCHGF